LKNFRITPNITTISKNVIQIGDNTHNQLQSMMLVSFSMINTMVNKPTNPMPPDDDDDDDDDILLMCFLFSYNSNIRN